MRRLFTRDGVLLLETAVLLVLIRLALLVFSFRIMLQVANRAFGTSSGGKTRGPMDIGRTEWAVLRASRFIPGTRHCLTQAFVAKMLFAQQGRAVELRIGVAKDRAGRLVAHAWLESDGAAIFGATDSELRRYSSLPQLDRA
jgi:hypothetical protein